MGSIEIPEAELRIEMEAWYPIPSAQTLDSIYDVKFTLVFGGYAVTQQYFEVPVYDDDNYELDKCRDRFRKRVAERLSTLFETEGSES